MNYSKRQLEALGEPLGESVTQLKPGGFGRVYGSGGGGPTSSTTYTSNLPRNLERPAEALVGAATQEYFQTKPVTTTDPETGETKTEYQITGVKPFVPYSTRPEDYLAEFSPLQQQAQYEAAGMQRPGQYGTGTQFAGQAGMGGMQTAQQATGYGGAGYGAGMLGQQLGTQMGGYYGGMGAGYGGQAAGIAPTAQLYGGQAAGTGQQYAQMATDPRAIQGYMSPYMQNVVDVQKQAAMRDYQENILPQIQAQAVRAGAYGGSRDAVQRAMAQRNLASQLQGIQATGTQKAYEDAQRAQQFGITSGLQGYQTGLQGLGQAGQLYGLGMQGAQTGLQGLQQQLAGTAQGMQGAQVGLQGVSGAQAGYGLTGQMGRTMADIGTAQQAADISRMDIQNRLGTAQQAREQSVIDQAIKNYQMAREYPYEQLSRYSGLLRGYYTPTTTTTSYQAPPSAASQVAGGGMSAYALSQLAKGAKKGGAIKEKKFAEGGITSIDKKVLNDPTAYPKDVIQKGIADKSISKMIGAIALDQIGNAKVRAQQAQAAQNPPPQGTILGDLMANAGIDQAPSNLRSMAGGGIVAFAGDTNGSYVDQDLFDYIRQKETGGYRGDPNFAISPKGARGIMQIMPGTAMKPGFGVPTIFQLADAAGVDYKDKTEDEAKRLLTNPNLNVAFGERYASAMQNKFGGNPVLAAAAYNAGPGAVERAGGVPDIAETKKYVAGISPERFEKASEKVRAARREQMGLPPMPAKPAPAQPIPGAERAIDQITDITKRGVAEDNQRLFSDMLYGRAPIPKRATPNDPTLMAEAAPPGMPPAPKETTAPTPEAKPEEDSDIAALRKSIAARREELGKQREQDKYMALLAAGLGMMGGTSRHAMQNIGQGALQGVAAMQASRKEQREAEQDVLASELGLSRATLYEKMRMDQLKSNKDIAAAKNAIAQQLADLKQQQGYRDAVDMWDNSPARRSLEADIANRYGKNWQQDDKAKLELSVQRNKFIQELLRGGRTAGIPTYSQMMGQ